MTDWIADNEIGDRHTFWTRANVGEVLPEPPTLLGWDLVVGAMLQGWRDCFLQRMGADPTDLSEDRPEVIGIFGGYAYLGATMIRVWAERTPGMSAEMVDAAYFGEHPDVPPYEAQPWHQRPEAGPVMEQWLGWVMTADDLPELRADRAVAAGARASRPDLSAASDAELVARARRFQPDLRRMFDQHINMSGAASIGPGIIAATCAAVGRPAVALDLIAGLGDVDSAAPAAAMWKLSRLVHDSPRLCELFDSGPRDLSRRLRDSGDGEVAAFVAELDDFLVEFGSRGPNEWEIQAGVWENEPDLVLAAVDRMRLTDSGHLPTTRQTMRDAQRQRLASEVVQALGGDPAAAQFEAALGSAALFVPARERTKTNIIRLLHEVRMAAWELGRRTMTRAPGVLDQPSDICYVGDAELEVFLADPQRFAGTVAERRAHHAELRDREPPFIVFEHVPPPADWPRRDQSSRDVLTPGQSLDGVPGCAGFARGRARIVLDPADPTVLEPGDILVAPHTDPAWTPLFVPAAAVVVDVGAPLSHAIIVSRELGIPCVVSVTDATRRIPGGAMVEVDGYRGTVTVLAEAAQAPSP